MAETDPALLRALIEELRPYAAKPLGSIRIDTDDVRKIVEWFDATERLLSLRQAGVEAVAFPADGELLHMERFDERAAFWKWALGVGLPQHMEESGLGRFHADDRTEWAWQGWCAALVPSASREGDEP